MKPSRSEFIELRGLRYHVRHWGSEDAPKLFMIHGWMDVSASFQFLVDALKQNWQIIAPDWRGYGQSQHSGSDTYWYGDFLGDLDRLLHHYQPDQPVNLLGHSFGGSVASFYAGLRPARVRRLINLDGYGPRSDGPEARLARYRRWLRRLERPLDLQGYASWEELEQRLQKGNPRMPADRIAFLARHWAREEHENEGGRILLAHDPMHALNEGMHLGIRLDDAMAAWRAVEAPTLILLASHGGAVTRAAELQVPGAGAKDRFGCFRHAERLWFDDAGHLLHIERPQEVAPVIERFLLENPK